MHHDNMNVPYQHFHMPYRDDMQTPYGGMMEKSHIVRDANHELDIQDFCESHRHHYVILETDDGRVYEGIIENTNEDEVVLLAPIGDVTDETDDRRQYWFGGYGHPFEAYEGYGHPYGGYGYGIPFRFRRFFRFHFPHFRIRRFFFPFYY